MEKTLNKIINKPSTLQKLVDGINDKLRGQDVLNAMSKGATDAAREAFKKAEDL
jgi:hypothetical protein